MKLKCGHHIIRDECKICTEFQNKWYRKLAESFDDAEDFSHPDRPLKCWHRNMLKKFTTLEVEITHDYYDKAVLLLHSFQFRNDLQKRIWELHCQGLSRIKIEDAISEMPNACKQSQIRNIIKDLEREIEW
jgi:hypothetical protein